MREQRASNESAAGDTARCSWIASRIRVAEVIFDATRAATLQLQFDGSPRALPIQMLLAQVPGAYAPTLHVRLRTASLDDEPWLVGGAVTLWFAKRDGFYAFRAERLAASRNTLVLAMPEGVLRHSRRAEQRYLVPRPYRLRVVVAAENGTWREALELGEISTGGLSAFFAAESTFEVGAAVRLGLRLQADRVTVFNARVCHVQPVQRVSPDDPETQCVGLAFVGLPPMVRLALERYFLRTKAAPLPDVVTGYFPALPEAVRRQLCQTAIISESTPPVTARR